MSIHKYDKTEYTLVRKQELLITACILNKLDHHLKLLRYDKKFEKENVSHYAIHTLGTPVFFQSVLLPHMTFVVQYILISSGNCMLARISITYLPPPLSARCTLALSAACSDPMLPT